MTRVENLVSLKLTNKEIATLQGHFKAISDLLKPHMVALTNEERRQMPKMSDKSVPFVEKALQYAKKYPELVPAFIDMSEMGIDVRAVETLNDLHQDAHRICGNLDDTRMLAGSEAYVAALAFYNSVKMGTKMNVPAAKQVYEDLKKRFEAQGQRREETPEAV